MASIIENLQAILSARYGRDVRNAIHDSISDLNEIANTAQTSAKAYYEGTQRLAQTVSGNVGIDDSTATLSTTYSSHKIENKTRTNLLNPTLETMTRDGLTCTANGDGTYTFNGAPIARRGFFLLPLGQGYDMKSGVTYRLSGCPNGGGSTTYELIAEAELGTTYIKQYAHEYGNGVSFTVPQADIDAGYKLRLTMSVRCKVTNLTFKPMLTTGLDATYNDFVQYSGNGELNTNVAEMYKEIQNLKNAITELGGTV